MYYFILFFQLNTKRKSDFQNYELLYGKELQDSSENLWLCKGINNNNNMHK